MYGTGDLLSTSTGYPFYVSLDSVEGLLLGQHVYIRLAGVNSGSDGRVLIPESYLMDYAYSEETMITSAAVWCPNEDGKLAKQTVVLGEYLADIGCYVILEGLTLESYVADPSNPDCREGALTDLRAESDFGDRETVSGDNASDPADTIGGTLKLTVDCGLLQLDSEMALSDLKSTANSQIDPEKLQALPEVLGWLCMEGDLTCSRNGDSYSYELALDQTSMKELSRMILPELAQYGGDLTEGSVSIILQDNAVASMYVSIKGKISVLFTQSPVTVGADFIFE